MEDVRKWAKWQKQGIPIAILGVIAIFVGLAIAIYSGQTYRDYGGYGYNSVANFAFCGVIPGGVFMIIAGIASYYYYGEKVKRHGTQETERD